MRVYFARGDNHSLKRWPVATGNPQGPCSRLDKDLTRVPWRTISDGSVNPNGSRLRLKCESEMQSTPDEVLIGRIANGDRLAMQVLYARYHVRVFRFVVRLVRDEATAEDVISEVFLDVWRQAGRFEGRSTVSTWLLAIARFKAISALRRRPDEELDEEAAAAIEICRTIPQPRWRRRIRVQCCESASQDFRRNIGRS